MNEEKDIKSIKLSLPYVTEDGKSTLREMLVTFKKIVEKDKGRYNNTYFPTYSMGMSVVIPDHVHARLKGAEVPRKRDFTNKGTDYKLDFPKTLTSSTLEGLTSAFREIMWDYKWLLDLDSMELVKAIFYSFDGNNRPNETSSWDGKKMGSSTEISYSYMIGYVSKDGKYRLNKDKKMLASKDGGEIGWKHVEHTDERELFFSTIFSRFGDILSQLQEFEKKISPKTIDSIIQSGLKLLGN